MRTPARRRDAHRHPPPGSRARGWTTPNSGRKKAGPLARAGLPTLSWRSLPCTPRPPPPHLQRPGRHALQLGRDADAPLVGHGCVTSCVRGERRGVCVCVRGPRATRECGGGRSLSLFLQQAIVFFGASSRARLSHTNGVHQTRTHPHPHDDHHPYGHRGSRVRRRDRDGAHPVRAGRSVGSRRAPARPPVRRRPLPPGRPGHAQAGGGLPAGRGVAGPGGRHQLVRR